MCLALLDALCAPGKSIGCFEDDEVEWSSTRERYVERETGGEDIKILRRRALVGFSSVDRLQ